MQSEHGSQRQIPPHPEVPIAIRQAAIEERIRTLNVVGGNLSLSARTARNHTRLGGRSERRFVGT